MEICFYWRVSIVTNDTKLNPKFYSLPQHEKFSKLFFVENIALEVLTYNKNQPGLFYTIKPRVTFL